MYKDHMMMINDLRNYASPRARITRMISSGEVIQVRRGIFLDAKDKNYSLKSLAAIIYGPSYISFEYALSYYGIIPERVTALTCAVYNKNKNHKFITPVGDFYYYYLPSAVFPYEVIRKDENNQSYLIASPEKALLDTLYKIKEVNTFKALTSLLFEDLRMDNHMIMEMNKDTIFFLAPLYKRKICTLFLKWFEGEAINA